MKLSHILIATLVSSSFAISAQVDTKPKNKEKIKTEKCEKTKSKKTVKAKKNTKNVSANILETKEERDDRICVACGRG